MAIPQEAHRGNEDKLSQNCLPQKHRKIASIRLPSNAHHRGNLHPDHPLIR